LLNTALQWTGGYAARFLSIFVALSSSRFDPAVILPPQQKQADRRDSAQEEKTLD